MPTNAIRDLDRPTASGRGDVCKRARSPRDGQDEPPIGKALSRAEKTKKTRCNQITLTRLGSANVDCVLRRLCRSTDDAGMDHKTRTRRARGRADRARPRYEASPLGAQDARGTNPAEAEGCENPIRNAMTTPPVFHRHNQPKQGEGGYA